MLFDSILSYKVCKLQSSHICGEIKNQTIAVR